MAVICIDVDDDDMPRSLDAHRRGVLTLTSQEQNLPPRTLPTTEAEVKSPMTTHQRSSRQNEYAVATEREANGTSNEVGTPQRQLSSLRLSDRSASQTPNPDSTKSSATKLDNPTASPTALLESTACNSSDLTTSDVWIIKDEDAMSCDSVEHTANPPVCDTIDLVEESDIRESEISESGVTTAQTTESNLMDLTSLGDDDCEDFKSTKRRLKAPAYEKPNKKHKRVALAGNGPLSSTQRDLDSYRIDDQVLIIGDVVELASPNHFLKIRMIIQDTTANTTSLRGHLFQTTDSISEFVRGKKNEVCWLLDVDLADSRAAELQSMHTVSIGDIVKPCKLRMTNHTFSAEGASDHGSNSHDNQDMLVCRSKHVNFYQNAYAKERKRKCEEAFIFLRKDEFHHHNGNSPSNEQLRQQWRGPTERGGAQHGWFPGEEHYLRQEAYSAMGEKCFHTLKASERNYAKSEVMDREAVAHALIPSPSHPHIFNKITGMGSDNPTFSQYNVVTGETTKDLGSTPLEYYFGYHSDSQFDDGDDVVEITEEAYLQQTPAHMSSELKAWDVNLGVDDELILVGERPRPAVEERRPLRHGQHLSDHMINSTMPANEDDVILMSSSQHAPSFAGRRYTIGDCFCGGGGMSRGAIMAGLRVKWGFDSNRHACLTYARNFMDAFIFFQSAIEICSPEFKFDLRVDILHISPPCQPFSPAHTTAGKNDAANREALLRVGDLIDKTRPRIAIVEQTQGLEQRHWDWLATLIQFFTERCFSLRYKILQCADYGLAQRRTRLFLVAACPGETLPPFPAPTHIRFPRRESSLMPWSTINTAIAKVPVDWPDHDTSRPIGEPKPPYSGEKIATCITTSGAHMRHPSGVRSFSHRELACLQGFPLCHKFGNFEVIKQIGNAVAPIVGKAVLEQVKKTLLETDEMEERLDKAAKGRVSRGNRLGRET